MRAPRTRLPRLHVVTDDDVLAGRGFVETAADLLRLGEDLALHVRGPHTSARRVYDIVQEVAPVAVEHGSLLAVNDRLDVALATGPGVAVHLGERSLPPADARRLGPTRIIGRSVHDVTAAEAIADVDFIVFGNVWPTASHPGRPGAGVDRLAEMVGAVACPVLAIGGVSVDRVGAVRATGAWGVAVLGGVWHGGDPVASASDYISILREATGSDGEPTGSASIPGEQT